MRRPSFRLSPEGGLWIPSARQSGGSVSPGTGLEGNAAAGQSAFDFQPRLSCPDLVCAGCARACPDFSGMGHGI